SLCFSFSLLVPRPSRSTLFPYTTLFRSQDWVLLFPVRILFQLMNYPINPDDLLAILSFLQGQGHLNANNTCYQVDNLFLPTCMFQLINHHGPYRRQQSFSFQQITCSSRYYPRRLDRYYRVLKWSETLLLYPRRIQ